MSISGVNLTGQQNKSPNFGMHRIKTRGFTSVEKLVARAGDTNEMLAGISGSLYQVIKKVWVVSQDGTEKFYPCSLPGRLASSLKLVIMSAVGKPTQGDLHPAIIVDTYKDKPSILDRPSILSRYPLSSSRILTEGKAKNLKSLSEAVAGIQDELYAAANKSAADFRKRS